MALFHFKYFDVQQSNSIHKVGTDSMLLGALLDFNQPRNILDVGTGTGVLSLMCAQKFPKAKIEGIDIQQDAVSLAEYNFKNSPYAKRVEAINKNYLHFSSVLKYDIILSNPPYFNTKMLSPEASRNMARQECSMPILDLINHSKELLTENGQLWLILPEGRAEEIEKESKVLDLKIVQIIPIFGKPQKQVRTILVFSTSGTKLVTKRLTIRDDLGNYSNAYKELTKVFHCPKLK